MGGGLLDVYRRQWPRIGAVIALALGGFTALASRRLTKTRLLSAVNLVALLSHQSKGTKTPDISPVSSIGAYSKATAHGTIH